ncbi:hypothetical protein MRX96_049357, partial [Rhipicephalus microplus]
MPLENLEEDSLAKNPDLELAQMKFLLARHEPHNDKLKAGSHDGHHRSGTLGDQTAKELISCSYTEFLLRLATKYYCMPFSCTSKVRTIERGDDMAPFYEETCADLNWAIDQELAAKMRAANVAELARLDAAIEDAEKNLSETEVRDGYLRKAEYLSRIG